VLRLLVSLPGGKGIASNLGLVEGAIEWWRVGATRCGTHAVSARVSCFVREFGTQRAPVLRVFAGSEETSIEPMNDR